MQPDAVPATEIATILNAGISYTAITIYWCGAADAPGVGPFNISHPCHVWYTVAT
jgi:hypothetical protein